MAFLPGNKSSLGRPKGALNKRSDEFRIILEKHNFCPVTAMMEVYTEAKKTYDNYGTIYAAIADARQSQNDRDGSMAAPTEDNAHKYLKIAGDMAKDIAGYVYPKLKSIEHQANDPTRDMSPEQRLEAMKHAVAMLEMQVKAKSGSGTP